MFIINLEGRRGDYENIKKEVLFFCGAFSYFPTGFYIIYKCRSSSHDVQIELGEIQPFQLAIVSDKGMERKKKDPPLLDPFFCLTNKSRRRLSQSKPGGIL